MDSVFNSLTGGVNDEGNNAGILGQKDDKTLWEGMEVQDEAGASRGRLKSWKHAASTAEAWEEEKEIAVPGCTIRQIYRIIQLYDEQPTFEG